jgi:hypothetical protein
MSGGGSKSVSKPTYTPQQIKVFEWMQQNIVPLAEGKETYLTQLMAQRARDEAAKLQGQQEMGIQNMAGTTGMSAGQVGGLMQSSQQQMIQATLQQIMNQRIAQQQGALNMIAGIPMSPGQETVDKGEDPFKAALGRTGAKLIGVAGGAALGGGIGGKAGAASGMTAMGG